VDQFCDLLRADLLRAKLTLSQYRLPDLAGRGPHYRTDSLFEAGADLSDMVLAFSAGRVGESVVLQEALRVAAEACLVYVATVRHTRREGVRDGD
jgi:hypothetical protein